MLDPSSNRQIQNKQFANEIFTPFERCYIKGQDQKRGNQEEMKCRRDDRRYPKLSTEMEPTYWMPENRIPRKALQYQHQEKRDLGRPYRRWKDQFM
jgi:hypothetical protein